jgi:tetratricopeptide (TPR) repeat protein
MAQPNLIELDEAISRIKQACDYNKTGVSRFFFMVGAGMSYPSVPLALDITAKCKEVALEYGRTRDPAESTDLASYSHWFQTAFPEPSDRQDYLRALIEEKPITHANFRLAHLLLNNTISDIVVTTNFDDFLSRALTLFGRSHIICDHPQTVSRINIGLNLHRAGAKPIVQIIHLHGSYWFYDCCNLKDELERRAERSTNTTLTMGSLLDMLLWQRSPLVLGYSGWEGDVFMEALKRRLATPLGTNVYWFCYRRSMVSSMPEILKTNPNIRFVVPPEMTSQTTVEAIPGEQRKDSRQQTLEASTFAAQTEPSLPADTVLARLIHAFGLEAPDLTNDPLGFFAKQLNESLPKGDASDTGTDIYSIKRVIDRVNVAKQREEGTPQEAATPSQSMLDQMRDSLRRADYRQTIRYASQLKLSKLTPEELNDLISGMWSAALGLTEAPNEELSACNLVLAGYDELVSRKTDITPSARNLMMQALFRKGLLLGTLNQPRDAITAYDELVKRYDESPQPAEQEYVAWGIFNKGVAFGTLGESEAALAAYDEDWKRFGESGDAKLKEPLGRALLNKAGLLGIAKAHEAALALYEQTIERESGASESALLEQVAHAQFGKGYSLESLGRSEEAIAEYDKLASQYAGSTDLIFQRWAARALFNKAGVLKQLGKIQETVNICDEMIQRYGEVTDSQVQVLVAKSLFNKGNNLGILERHSEALQVYEDVVRRYQNSTDPELQEQVGNAHNGIGFRRLLEAKGLWREGREKDAKDELQQAKQSVDLSLQIAPYDPIKIGNQAYIAFLMGDKELAGELLQRAIQLGGEDIRKGELNDAEINRLPQDDEFSKLVQSIPNN